ncbi:futalosine hydrolase [Olivibacter ginsenosidimutans]|uniref:Futalosine hydrolase n=1 Tax=Olivibacter ginsenosidimutans TaxID=1176537 RepID=A0ABP9ALD3_9SPHI
MARCLVVAATAAEIAPFLEVLAQRKQAEIDVLLTDVGMVATAFQLGKALHQKTYDYAVQVGIAGAITKDLALGEVVFVAHDTFYELGAEDHDDFLTIEQLGFGKSTFHAMPGVIPDGYAALTRVAGITVNRVHGNEQSIAQLRSRSNAAVESMEGAAFYYACQQAGLSCIQVRSISNYVEKRNRANWKIGLAVKNLNEWLISCSHLF